MTTCQYATTTTEQANDEFDNLRAFVAKARALTVFEMKGPGERWGKEKRYIYV